MLTDLSASSNFCGVDCTADHKCDTDKRAVCPHSPGSAYAHAHALILPTYGASASQDSDSIWYDTTVESAPTAVLVGAVGGTAAHALVLLAQLRLAVA
jgi:hypothetical protein